ASGRDFGNPPIDIRLSLTRVSTACRAFLAPGPRTGRGVAWLPDAARRGYRTRRGVATDAGKASPRDAARRGYAVAYARARERGLCRSAALALAEGPRADEKHRRADRRHQRRSRRPGPVQRDQGKRAESRPARSP